MTRIIKLDGDIEKSGKSLIAPPELLDLFTEFCVWIPIAPRSPKQLAETAARLCRLLRDEVSEQLGRGAPGLTGLKEDRRKLLFPTATDTEFADGYAQAVTLGLLMAKARNISLANGIEDAAKALRKSNSLIGAGALGLVIERLVPLELAEEFQKPPLPSPVYEFLQRQRGGGFFAALTASRRA